MDPNANNRFFRIGRGLHLFELTGQIDNDHRLEWIHATCHNCKRRGHRSSHCDRPQQELRCTYCTQARHNAEQCRLRLRANNILYDRGYVREPIANNDENAIAMDLPADFTPIPPNGVAYNQRTDYRGPLPAQNDTIVEAEGAETATPSIENVPSTSSANLTSEIATIDVLDSDEESAFPNSAVTSSLSGAVPVVEDAQGPVTDAPNVPAEPPVRHGPPAYHVVDTTQYLPFVHGAAANTKATADEEEEEMSTEEEESVGSDIEEEEATDEDDSTVANSGRGANVDNGAREAIAALHDKVDRLSNAMLQFIAQNNMKKEGE